MTRVSCSRQKNIVNFAVKRGSNWGRVSSCRRSRAPFFRIHIRILERALSSFWIKSGSRIDRGAVRYASRGRFAAISSATAFACTRMSGAAVISQNCPAVKAPIKLHANLLSRTDILRLGNQRMTSRIGKKIAKRCGWSVQHQQAILLAFGEARSSCEFHNCSLTAGLSASSPREIEPRRRPLLGRRQRRVCARKEGRQFADHFVDAAQKRIG